MHRLLVVELSIAIREGKSIGFLNTYDAIQHLYSENRDIRWTGMRRKLFGTAFSRLIILGYVSTLCECELLDLI